jgi:nucleoid DNA-binding protein
MKLDQHISQLLFQYDCVIVPNLGGFVANYKPASIQPIKNTFYPPSKGISFNKNLINNDGLLVNAICKANKTSYEEASKIVEEAVLMMKATLKKNNKLVVENVGVLFYDKENRIQFEPSTDVNYLLESFGLSSFQQFPVQHETIEEKIVKTVKETPVIALHQKKNSKKWIAAAIITIPLAFFAFWLPTKYDLGADLNYANLNPFKTLAEPVYVARTTVPVFEDLAKDDVKTTIESVNENNPTASVAFLKEEEPIVVKMEETAIDTTRVEMPKVKLRFHIVGGCFSEERNAKKLVRKLNKAGFNAWIIGKRKGLYAVSYNSFETRQEAVDALASAQNHNSKAWILEQ